jgi:malate dehydrogenase
MLRTKIFIDGADHLALTITHLLRRREYAMVVNASGDLQEIGGADLVILTSQIEPDTAQRLAERAPDAVVIVAGEGEASCCEALLRDTCFPRQRIFGAGGVRAARRLRNMLAADANVNPRDVTGLVVGGAENGWVPVTSTVTLAGIDADATMVAAIESRSQADPEEFVATATAVCELADAVMLDQHRLLPCVAACHGEYGVEGRFTCVPAKVGRVGIEEILEIELTPQERAAL